METAKDANESLVTGVLVKAYNASGTQCGTATTSGSTSPNYTQSQAVQVMYG